MKTFRTHILAACLLLISLNLLATDWNTYMKMFRYQKDVDPSVSADYTRNMATVCYRDTLYNFVNYKDISVKSSVIVRKIHHTGQFPDFTWHSNKYDNISDLQGLEGEEWQPAAVVFHDSLILFYCANIWQDNNANGTTRFAIYNRNHNSWGGDGAVPGNYYGGITSHGMAAVVLDDKLCLVTHDHSDNIEIHWTKDLKTWYHFTTLENIGSSSGEDDAISAVAAPYWDQDLRRKSKLMFAYRDGSKHPFSVEYKFSNDTTLTFLRKTAISISDAYSSVALAVGTITSYDGSNPDPTSTGDCVQAFLKRDAQDNGHVYHRIIRFQLKDTIWTKIEKNVLPQNSPVHMWASREIPLTTTMLSIPDGQDVRQYICLVYRGYDNWNYPLNVAWAETNMLKYNALKTRTSEDDSTSLAGPQYTQYLGYVEGPPPFKKNHYQPATHPSDTLINPMVNENALDISSLEFSSSSSTSSSTEIGYEVGLNCKFKAEYLSGEASFGFGQVWDNDYSKTQTHTVEFGPTEENTGYYITLRPIIYRASYDVYDVNKNWVDSIFYFFATDPKFIVEPVQLQNGLASDDPSTFYHRSGISFPSFYTTSYGNIGNSWTKGVKVSSAISVEQAESQANSISAKFKLGAEFGEIFEIGFDASFEYSITTTTRTGNEITSATRLNEPIYPKDVRELAYDTYWIKPNRSSGINNWWLHEGALDQNTWCVTYDVTYVKYHDGTTIGHSKGVSGTENGLLENEQSHGSSTDPGSFPEVVEPEQLPPSEFSLAQNYPNPFLQATKIKYQIGSDNTASQTNGYSTRLSIYNLSGSEVATLVNENKMPGTYEIDWDASKLNPGVYFYTLQSGSFRSVKKLILLK